MCVCVCVCVYRKSIALKIYIDNCFSWAEWVVYSIKVTTETLYSTYIYSNKHVKLYIEVYTNKPKANDHVN